MGAIETKTFRSGGQIAVHLPPDLDFLEGTVVRVERIGAELRVKPLTPRDPVEDKRRLTELIARLQEVWKDAPRPEVEQREPIEFPDRPGL